MLNCPYVGPRKALVRYVKTVCTLIRQKKMRPTHEGWLLKKGLSQLSAQRRFFRIWGQLLTWYALSPFSTLTPPHHPVTLRWLSLIGTMTTAPTRAFRRATCSSQRHASPRAKVPPSLSPRCPTQLEQAESYILRPRLGLSVLNGSRLSKTRVHRAHEAPPR